MKIEHHDCPKDIIDQLRLAGGTNAYNEAMFRVIWGWDRIVPVHGQWEDWETMVVDMPTGQRKQIRLKRSVIETRMVPKYLPPDRWHLEKWCPPEMYGSPEQWTEAGREHLGLMTVNTSGAYPSRGEYELVITLSTTGGPDGGFVPLEGYAIEEIVKLIVAGGNFTLAQRAAAIRQRIEREEKQWQNRVEDVLRDGLRPFAGEDFVTKL